MNISSELARQRFTTIPSRLQDALFSEQTADLVDSISQQQKLSNEQAGTIGKIVSWVLLGFLNQKDVTQQLQEQLSLTPQIASEISRSLDDKIFNLMRDDLNSVYAPIPASPEESSLSPKILQEIKNPAKPPTPPIAPKPPIPPAPQIISQAYTATPNLGGSPLASNRNMAAPAPSPQPATPSSSNNGAGWSRRAPQEPTVKLGAITPQVPTPLPPKAPMTSAPIAPSIPRPMPRPMPATMPIPTAPKPQQPAPMIIHEQSSLPTQAISGFQLRTPPHDQMATTVPKPSAPQPARFEFNAPPKPPTPPAPPAPPRMPMPPTPPKAQGNVIVKDFL